ncbi:MAG: hypothetical protein LBN08_03690 [Lactobacillales bacterium]|jgi:hypothetical protein|nr:hypothetical protein [Lactobacillales bacterium]
MRKLTDEQCEKVIAVFERRAASRELSKENRKLHNKVELIAGGALLILALILKLMGKL